MIYLEECESSPVPNMPVVRFVSSHHSKKKNDGGALHCFRDRDSQPKPTHFPLAWEPTKRKVIVHLTIYQELGHLQAFGQIHVKEWENLQPTWFFFNPEKSTPDT